MSSNKSEIDQFKELTWEDIENWAGSKVLLRGRKYQKGRLVTRLAKTSDNGIIADVAGSEAYTTFVAFRDKNIASHCTCPERGRYGRRWSEYTEDHIAKAIEKNYPDRAAAIWKGLAEGQISLTKPSAYDAAAVYLKKLQGLLASLGRGEECTRYLASLRQAHARKPRLLQTLARLEGRKIIDEK